MASADAHRFVQAMLLATEQAGAVALHLQGQVQHGHKNGTGSPEAAAVSVADLASQDVLLLALHHALPEAAVDAEEETEAVTLFPAAAPHRPLAILDPIDGSLNYLDMSADFAVMAAWLEGGVYRAAVVHFPAWEETYWGIEDGGVWHRRQQAPPRRVTLPEPRPASLLVSSWLPPETTEALARLGLELVTTRCSAVDSTAPINGRARGSWIHGAPGRRRSIGFFLTHLAGGIVHIGGQRWAAQDPYTLPPGPSFTAADEETAAQLAAIAAAAR
jgi:fructose-1,6-bisphosphatase/inositol monophosphatase family enzyme